MAVEINWIAGIPGCLRACLGSRVVICQSQTVRQLLHPGANLSSSAEGVTAPSISTQPHSFTTGGIYWAGGMGGSGRSREEGGKGSRMWQKCVLCWPVKWKRLVRQDLIHCIGNLKGQDLLTILALKNVEKYQPRYIDFQTSKNPNTEKKNKWIIVLLNC